MRPRSGEGFLQLAAVAQGSTMAPSGCVMEAVVILARGSGLQGRMQERCVCKMSAG